MTSTLARILFAAPSAVLAALSCLVSLPCAAQDALDEQPLEPCVLSMEPEKAMMILNFFSKNTRVTSKFDRNFAITTEIDMRAPTGLSAAGFLKTDFVIVENGPFGKLKTGKPVAGLAMRYGINYDPDLQQLTVELEGEGMPIGFIAEVRDTVAVNSTVKDNFSTSFEQGDKKESKPMDPSFDFGLETSRADTSRTLTARAFGLPGHARPVLECDQQRGTFRAGAKLMMDFNLQFDVTVIQKDVTESDNLSLSDKLRKLSSSSSKSRSVTKQALPPRNAAASAKGELSGFVLGDLELMETKGEIPFEQTAGLEFMFSVDGTTLTSARAANLTKVPSCRPGRTDCTN